MIRSLVPAVCFLASGIFAGLEAAPTGPNMLPNSSFEGGKAVWKMSSPFSVVNDATNAHTGSWELQAALAATPTYQYCYQSQDVWHNTNYVSTVWVKGSGTLVLGVLNTSNYQFIATVNVTATSDWQQVTLPWNSGAYGNVWLFVYDTVTGNTGTTVYLDDYQTFLAQGSDIQFDPTNPAASGYSLKFDEEFNDASTIDTNHTGAPGFNWYVGQYFNLGPTPSSMYSVSGGALTILNNPPESGMTVHTTEPDLSNGKGFHGTVITAGAGVYIEARIALPNVASISGSSWPSFWSEDLKLETRLNDQMPGYPSNYENIEEDFMEYNPYWAGTNAYFSTIHDISGTFAPGPSYNISNSNSEIPVAVGTDFSQWHTYGHLWVPASAANGWIGYRQIFFDGVPQAATCWPGYPAGTFPPSGSPPFSLKDHDQFDLIFGGSATGIPSMLVDYVHVYAVSSSSVTVVPPGPPGTVYGTSSVAGLTGGSVTLTFPGLPGNPSGAIYTWYLNGTVIATTNSASYTIANALPSQSGTYTVYAWAPGSPTNITGNATFAVTISDVPPVSAPVLSTSTSALVVPDGSSVPFTVSLSAAPTSDTSVTVAINGSPAVTVSPAVITMTATNFQNIPVTVTAAAINSNDSARTATITLTAGASVATVGVTDAVSDTQTAANLATAASPLIGSNIGDGSAGGSSVHTSGNWWIDGSGVGGITGAADSFHFESQSFTGDFKMVVQVQSLTAFGATSPLSGLMIRDGTDAGSNFLALAGQVANGGYALVQRTALNAAATEMITTGAPPLAYTYPNTWMMLSRIGSVLHAFVSSDGLTYTEITDPIAGVTWTGMSGALNIGVFSSSASTANARAVMNNFSLSTPTTFTDRDIGGTAHAGSVVVNGNNITVKGGGDDIWNNSDQFNLYSTPLTGSAQSLVVHVDSVAGGDSWAKGGVMFRNSSAATSPFVALYAVPSRQVTLQWRDTESGSASSLALTGDATSLKWLKLTKSGTTFTAYYATTTASPGTSDWIAAGTHTTAFASSTFLGGLAVTGHNNSGLGTGVFDNLAVSGSVVAAPPPPPPPPPSPTSYTDADIGMPAHAGSALIGGNNLTIQGGGGDIWNSNDQFNYYSESLTGALQSVMVHVQSVTGADSWAKGGVMFRNSSTASSPFVALEAVPSRQVTLQWRDTEGGSADSVALAGDTTSPKWLLLTKNGAIFSAYYATTTAPPMSSDWILAGMHTCTFANTTYLGGLAVTGHNNSGLGTSIFDNLSITAAAVVAPPAPPVVTGYLDADIGSPAMAGSAAINAGILTVSGGGADIWGFSDQFNFYYQQNTTDVSLVVHVGAVQNTNSWAKGGIMFRNSITATSPFVVLEQVPNRQVSLQWRDTEGAGVSSQPTNLVGDTTSLKWLKLVKTGATFTAYYATTTSVPAATDWSLVGTHTTTFTNSTYLGGLSVTSHNNAVLGSASFDSLSQQ